MSIAKRSLFKINEKDFTNNILLPTYKVNKNGVYITWEDSQHKEHKKYVRDKISGDFQMYFDTMDEFEAFTKAVKTNDDGYTYVYAYCTNILEYFSFYATIEWDPSDILPLIGVEQYDGITIKITER